MRDILVVDNDRFVLEYLSDLLSSEKYQVVTVPDGLSALDILKDWTPDVIFIDLIMPNINGRKLCQIIRKMEHLNHSYIVILSAVAAEEEINFTEFGADACVAKGPMEEMSRHILDILHQLDLDSSPHLLKEPVGVKGISPRGITKELLAVRRHFEMILEKMCEGIMEINSEGRIIYANQAAISLINIVEEKLLGLPFATLFDPGDQQRVDGLLKTLSEKPKTVSEDDPVKLNSSQVTMSISPITGEKNTAIVMINDITERKRGEAEREKLISDLQNALARVKTLSGMLPICSNCKKVRNDEGYWKKIETYISEHSDAIFTHSICPECREKLYPRFSTE